MKTRLPASCFHQQSLMQMRRRQSQNHGAALRSGFGRGNPGGVWVYQTQVGAETEDGGGCFLKTTSRQTVSSAAMRTARSGEETIHLA